MVFPKNVLSLTHTSGARISFSPFDALKAVSSSKMDVQVSCAEEWQETRPKQHLEEKVKPYDWTFTTDYQGTCNKLVITEPTTQKLDIFKLMRKENIFFYHDLSLFEDELHDHGVASCSVKIVSLLRLCAEKNIKYAIFSALCHLVSLFFCVTSFVSIM